MSATLFFDLYFTGVYEEIPQHMQNALRRYVLEGIAPGSFLTGVITNDLRMAVNYADAENLPLLKLYVQWFYNVAPGGCSGSRAAMQAWTEERAKQPMVVTAPA